MKGKKRGREEGGGGRLWVKEDQDCETSL